MPSLKKELLKEVHLLIQKEENSIINFLQNQNDHLLAEVNFLREEVKEKKKVIEKLMDNCRQNINHDISNNQNSFSTDDDDKSQKPIKGSKGVNSISVVVNTEILSEETLNLAETVASSPPHLVKTD